MNSNNHEAQTPATPVASKQVLGSENLNDAQAQAQTEKTIHEDTRNPEPREAPDSIAPDISPATKPRKVKSRHTPLTPEDIRQRGLLKNVAQFFDEAADSDVAARRLGAILSLRTEHLRGLCPELTSVITAVTTSAFREGSINCVEVGTFEVVSGTVFVADPFCELDDPYTATLTKVRNGTWCAEVLLSNEAVGYARVAKLTCYALGANVCLDDENWRRKPFTIGVEGGIAGIFDVQHFNDGSSAAGLDELNDEDIEDAPPYKNTPWYALVHRIIADDSICNAGVIPFGVASSAGYGDAHYPCYIQKNRKGEIVAIKIEFFDPYTDLI